MKYLLMLTGDEQEWQARPPEESAEIVTAHEAFVREIGDAGSYVHSHRLASQVEAVTVR